MLQPLKNYSTKQNLEKSAAFLPPQRQVNAVFSCNLFDLLRRKYTLFFRRCIGTLFKKAKQFTQCVQFQKVDRLTEKRLFSPVVEIHKQIIENIHFLFLLVVVSIYADVFSFLQIGFLISVGDERIILVNMFVL